ncbi:MAG: hypothetical protein A2X94_14940 [Bdellovibrionales bacterium GWB1_55_8]|nr:MAG: hypothetical protein A2X94_14940 [Bdellovibrionales bacterium GWB1_55_8]
MNTNGGRTPKSVAFGKQLIRYQYEPGELTRLCDESMELTAERLDAIAALKPAERGFENTVLAFENAIADLNDEMGPLTFMAYVSTDEKIHAEGAACEEKFGPFLVDVVTRKDLYDAMKEMTPRNDAERRLFTETMQEFEKNGLKLPDEKLEQVKKLKQDLSVLETQFSTNLNNDTTSVEFMPGELDGVSPDFLGRLKKADGGRLVVTTKSADYTHVMENAKSPDTRRDLMFAYYNKQADKNTALLEQAIALRHRIAELMGYPTWADYRLSDRMAKNSKAVLEFLNGLKSKLALRNKADLNQLLKFKKEIVPGATQVDAWDVNYLAYQLKKRDYALDQEKVKEYFPADDVVAGVFDIYSKLLGVSFREVKDADPWSPGVKLYEIADAQGGAVIAYFYTDFFPRKGKYGHFAAFSLVLGRAKVDGYSRPVSAVVGNFSPPTEGKPSLLKHDEVETFFHEFGHIMHQTLTRAPYSSLSGTSVARDFVEAPSQMFEGWAWSPEMLKNLSGHYQDAKKKLPDSMIKKMIDAKDFNRGYHYTRQLMLGLLDATYHTSGPSVDTTKVHDDLYRELVGLEPLGGGHFQAGFGHLMGGYDAGYYGYLWSEVFAEDTFTRFEKEGLLNAKVGIAYRRSILEQGKMVDPQVLLREFLGREPNSDAFFRKLGIKK